MDTNTYGVMELAYIGDAAYELIIRKKILEGGESRADKMHRIAVRYVSANGQAKAVRGLLDGFLSDEESRLVKRARNHQITSHPRGADPVTYKLATGFEALIGYLELSGDTARRDRVIQEAVHIIDN